MPEVLDWRRIGQPDIVARFVVSSLCRGALVAFPTESAYVAAAFGLLGEAVERLQDVVGARPLELAVSDGACVRDWLPGLGLAGQRLIRRFWPGPMTLVSREGAEEGLASRLPVEVGSALREEGALHLRQSMHPAIREVLHRLPGPLVCSTAPAAEGPAFTVRQLVEATGRRLDLLIDDGPGRFRLPATAVEVSGADWSIRTGGVLSAEDIREQLACSIVFVCTGNTCRSPLAEALCKKRLAERLGCAVEELPSRGYRVMSAGLAAGPGLSAAEEAVAVARALGADLMGHQSRPLTPDLIQRADHLLVMTAGHAQALQEVLPAGAITPELLSPDGDDVADPIGQSREVYEECARQLDGYIEALLRRVLPAGEHHAHP